MMWLVMVRLVMVMVMVVVVVVGLWCGLVASWGGWS